MAVVGPVFVCGCVVIPGERVELETVRAHVDAHRRLEQARSAVAGQREIDR